MPRLLAKGSQLAEPNDLGNLEPLDQYFHHSGSQTGSNSVLHPFMRSLRDRTALVFTPMNQERCLKNWEEHAAILRAVMGTGQELVSVFTLCHVPSEVCRGKLACTALTAERGRFCGSGHHSRMKHLEGQQEQKAAKHPLERCHWKPGG